MRRTALFSFIIKKMLASQTAPLSAHDPELYALIQAEKERQRSGLELIASVRP